MSNSFIGVQTGSTYIGTFETIWCRL